MSRHDRHDGVSCDVCSRNNFKGKRYKCLICNDYDLCAHCYENGAVSLAHAATHPMQAILTRDDYDLYFRGESVSHERAQSFICALCGRAGLTDATLYEHIRSAHADTPITGTNCPLCVASWRGDPNRKPDDLLLHLAVEHRLGSAADVDRHQAAFATFISRQGHIPPASRSNADSQQSRSSRASGRAVETAANASESTGLTRSGAFRVLPSASTASNLRAPGSVYAPSASTGASAVMRRRLGGGPSSTGATDSSSNSTVLSATAERRNDPDSMSAFAEALLGVPGGMLFSRVAAAQPQSTTGGQHQPNNGSDREREAQADHDALAELLTQLEGRLGGSRTDLVSLTQRMEQSLLNQLESRQQDSARLADSSARSQPESAIPISLSLASNATGNRQPNLASQQQVAAASSLMHALLGGVSGSTEQALLAFSNSFASTSQRGGANQQQLAAFQAGASRQPSKTNSPFLLVKSVNEAASATNGSDASHSEELSTTQLVLSALYSSLLQEPNVQELLSETDAFERERFTNSLLAATVTDVDRGMYHQSGLTQMSNADGEISSFGSATNHATLQIDAATIAASPSGLSGSSNAAETQQASQNVASQVIAHSDVAQSQLATLRSEVESPALQHSNLNNNASVTSAKQQQQQQQRYRSGLCVTRKILDSKHGENQAAADCNEGLVGNEVVDEDARHANLVRPPLAP